VYHLKETTKYNNYRFFGKINVDEIQPWFDFDKAKPWDEMEVPWVLENKVRREILLLLAESAKTFDEIYELLSFSPKPLIIEESEHHVRVKYQWTKETIENHLLNLEWYDLLKKSCDKYEITIPILKMEKIEEINNYILKIADKWSEVIKSIKAEASEKFIDLNSEKTPLFSVLIEKTVEKLYSILKIQGILPDVPNIKTLWAEQLRKIKFEDWVSNNF